MQAFWLLGYHFLTDNMNGQDNDNNDHNDNKIKTPYLNTK